MENSTLLNARKNIYSQNGEDGVIELLTDFLDMKEGSFCEFGAWDGKYLSNTYNLLENKNWKGVYIEGDKERYNDLLKLKDQYGDKLQTINAYVDHKGSNTLDNLLKDTFLEKNFDLLSIDVDGMDYHIWNAFLDYRPKLVIIEVNSNLRPGDFTISEIDTQNSWIGSGFSATCRLGIQKGYYPIIHFGNVFLGDKEFLESKNYKLNQNIDSLYN
jgi:nitrogen regulatory protein PII-like uncharacterized protein